MSRARTRKNRPHLPQWLALLLLLAFLSARGLVPAGFMPADFSAGTPYGLCHGDSRSALLLNSLANQAQDHHHNLGDNHSGHNHDTLTAHSFADNHCNFSAAASLAQAPALDLHLFIEGNILPPHSKGINPALSLHYSRPLIRAPPV
ncbi:hypothetical protein [Microbulbifer sp. THAF38]|uniref:hypothetical protein n=1 Tax=Microbulbifer sp. THAF38 TaxID=2587856 RepID=UPI001267F827|nr:hypothetical protein [Microbulbifer sp. THAF38]QFT56792.1 hypothetical protein FIU95_19760 [Microbulbifer sp. THAF38]